MRLLLASAAVALLFGLSPASAMCGAGQQASSGGMCGAPAATKQMSEWPEAPNGHVRLLQEHGDDGRHEV